MENYIINSVMLVVLVIFSIEDIRKKSLGIKQVIAVILAALLYRGYRICMSGIKWEEILAAGIFMLLLTAAAFFKMIGAGDIAIMLMLNMAKGFVFAFSVFLTAVTAAAVISVLLLCLGRVGRKYAMPLVPYICVSSVGVVLCG